MVHFGRSLNFCFEKLELGRQVIRVDGFDFNWLPTIVGRRQTLDCKFQLFSIILLIMYWQAS